MWFSQNRTFIFAMLGLTYVFVLVLAGEAKFASFETLLPILAGIVGGRSSIHKVASVFTKKKEGEG